MLYLAYSRGGAKIGILSRSAKNSRKSRRKYLFLIDNANIIILQ